MPRTAPAAFIRSLALMGFPSTNGFFSEFLLFQGGFLRATIAFSDYRVIVAILGVVATAVTAGYSLLALPKIFLGPANVVSSNFEDAPCKLTVHLTVLSIRLVIIGVYPEPMSSQIAPCSR